MCLLGGDNIKCPYCSYRDSKVIDSRENEALTRRRRECLKCKKRFTTYERIETAPLYIIKKDNSRELFDREKLKRGILKACEKRPIAIEKINNIVNNIESKLRSLKSTEIKSSFIGEEVIKALQKLDKVAYIRFASVYREFTDLMQFEKEVNRLLKNK